MRTDGFMSVAGSAVYLAGTAWPANAFAADLGHAGSSQVFGGAYILQVLGSLILVFSLIFVVLFLLRKLNSGALATGALIRVVASARVGTREKVVLLDAGDKQLLIGVAAGSVRTLHVFDTPLINSAGGGAERPDFSSLLNFASRSGGGK